MRISKQNLHPSLKRQIQKSLFQVVGDLKNEQEAQVFLQDFLNAGELETFAKRLSIAYWLAKGRSYGNIKTNLKVSSATIATIQTQMETKGYKLALTKMTAEEWANVWSERIKKLVKS